MESYFCRLNAPRTAFGQDMTAEEMEIMRQPMPFGVRP